MTLKELLDDWTDIDVTAYYLSCCIGVTDYDSSYKEFGRVKKIFWIKNDIGEMIYQMLDNLVETRILELNEIGNQYRWNKSFSGFWNFDDDLIEDKHL